MKRLTGSSVPRWVALAVALLLGLVTLAACGGGGAAGGTVQSRRPSTVPGSQTVLPSPLPTEALTVGTTGLRIVSVIPPPSASGPWVGDQVIVSYLPQGSPVAPKRCRLYVNGRRQWARAEWNTISPAQPILIFRLPCTYPPGVYRFRVVLVAGDASAGYDWDFDYDLTYD